MQVHAQLRQLRISPRKVRLVSGAIKGLPVGRARYQLGAIVKKSAHPMQRLLNSAIANATNNFNLEENNLFIKDVIVNEGPKLKRGLPKGFGRISPIEKKTSHIKLILEEKVTGLRSTKNKKKEDKIETNLDAKEATDKIGENQQVSRTTENKKKDIKPLNKDKSLTSRISGIGRRFFRRKTG